MSEPRKWCRAERVNDCVGPYLCLLREGHAGAHVYEERREQGERRRTPIMRPDRKEGTRKGTDRRRRET